jgi:glutathionyl-hydroquinone reductase
MLEKGWSFDTDFPNATGDTLGLGVKHMRDIYYQVSPSLGPPERFVRLF